MKFKFNVLLILTMSFGLVSCLQEESGITGNGEVVEEVRQIGEFDKLVVNGPFQVTVEQSDSDELIISGESNILPHIDSEVRNGYLVIDPSHHETLYINKPLIVTIPARALVEIELNGSGEIKAPAFEVEELHIHLRGTGIIDAGVNAAELSVVLSGSGEIEVEGTATDGDVYLEGYCDFKAFETQFENCDIEIYGDCDAEISVSNQLDVEIDGSGEVVYIGDPTVYEDIEGVGDVRKKE